MRGTMSRSHELDDQWGFRDARNEMLAKIIHRPLFVSDYYMIDLSDELDEFPRLATSIVDVDVALLTASRGN